MKRILTAMGNSFLNNELSKFAKYDLVCEDLVCQEQVIQKLSKTKCDALVISGLLQGQWSVDEFVEKLRKVEKEIRIILVTDEIDELCKKLLEENNVLDIFLDSQVEIEDIILAIDREEPIKQKYSMACEPEEEYVSEKELNPRKEIIIAKAIQKQEIITISGIAGSGKTTIAANLAKTLAGKSDSKVLVIDLDTLNGNLDELLGNVKLPEKIELTLDADKKSGINFASELIMKNRFDANILNEVVIECDGFDALTGNTSLHYCQNFLKDEYYDKILECAKEKYDFIIIDSSSNIFLDSTKWALKNASRVLFVTEANYISIKKMKQFLDISVKTWGILEGKIELIVNKKQKNGLDSLAISEIVGGLKIVGEIKLNEEQTIASYENILSNIKYIPKKSIMEKIEELKKTFFVTSPKGGEAVAN